MDTHRTNFGRQVCYSILTLAACALTFFLHVKPIQAFDLSVHGYFRNRVVSSDNLDLHTHNSSIPYSNNRFGFISYNQMRLRLMPNLKLGDCLALHAQFDILDNVLYGTSDTVQLKTIAPVVGMQALPPGGGSISMTGPSQVGENGAINVRRVWGDILTPIGLFRIGRQPSHWGLGIFQNDGNERQGDFGDTADRILYLTGHDVEERFFLFLQEQFGRLESYRIPLSKKDIAAAIGTIPETFSRLLLRLRNEKKIHWEGETHQLAAGFWQRFDGPGD